ncbi:sulfurtransferase [Streptomyces sp. NPDC090083]|uniref:sulfurtransferase n=1 Tax=Streptomyces sp. NPDC090083 TaxID=3365941 RepID=UPI00382D0C3A
MPPHTSGIHPGEILISPDGLAGLLGAKSPAPLPGPAHPLAPAPVVLLDATVVLAPPEHDGDYRSSSGEESWNREHIPGSQHVDLLTRFTDLAAPYHFAHPARDVVRRELAALGVTEDTTVALYDQGATQWAARLWWVLRDAGVPARVLDGGLPAWTEAGHPVAAGRRESAETVPGQPRSGAQSRPRPQPQAETQGNPFPRAAAADAFRQSLWADKGEVLAISEGRAPGILVCALGPAHFDGSTPTRYTRRGRIPASVNLPAHDATASDGRVLTGDALLAYAGRLRRADHDGPVVIYCGGGISASLTALALTLAGVHQVALYDGSLEEWTADEELPVVTGS